MIYFENRLEPMQQNGAPTPAPTRRLDYEDMNRGFRGGTSLTRRAGGVAGPAWYGDAMDSASFASNFRQISGLLAA